MADCLNCAGTGTTVIAVIALILVIIIIIIALVFYFFPSNAGFLEVRGANFQIQNGGSNGATGQTGPVATDNMFTGTNVIYISRVLTGNLTLNINPSASNFPGLTIAVKNTTPKDSEDDDTNYIQLQGVNGLTISDGGLSFTDGSTTVDALKVGPGGFAWLVCTSATSGSQHFVLLENTNPVVTS